MTQPPEVIPHMLDAMGDADAVYASRYVPGGGMKNVPTWSVA